MKHEPWHELRLVTDLFDRARVRRLRTISEFAEQEIRIPSGPHEGLRFRLDRHPVARLLFNELESGKWRRAFITGPNQDGKTFMSFVIIVLYLLFERRERVVLGAPSAAIAADKWLAELKPTIEKTRFKDELPTRGGGSGGGTPETIFFNNGAILRIMTAGGDDQSRSGFTAPNVIVTETEGFDEIGSSSREGTKFAQLEKRNISYGDTKLTLGECTVSHESGRTWSEYMAGSRSRIALPCPHCGEYVTPGREHFIGWQDAANEIEAMDRARIVCPECGAEWTDEERLAANRKGVVAHGDQKVDRDGKLVGEPPATKTLGFRWTCVNAAVNRSRMRDVAAKEWRAKRAEDEDTADKDLCQVEWVVPAKNTKEDVSGLDAGRIESRKRLGLGRGVIPKGTKAITLGADVGDHLIHWTLVAWGPDFAHVVDYDLEEAPSKEKGIARGIPLALTALRDRIKKGWSTKDGSIVRPSIVFVDSGDNSDIVRGWCESTGHPFFPIKGFGATQQRTTRKRESGSEVVSEAGDVDHYNVIRDAEGEYVEIDVDHWKSRVHRWWRTPLTEEGFTLFDGGQHLKFAKHQTAETQIREFNADVGRMVTRWVAKSKHNHYGDSLVYATVAGHAAGVRFGALMAAARQTAAMDATAEIVAATGTDWLHSHKGRY